MTKPEEPDFEGMTDAEYADWLYEHRDELEGESVEAEVSPNLSTVVSVRFPAGEIGALERAAAEAGVKLSTYIRQAALAAAHSANIELARRDVTKLRAVVNTLARHLGAA